MRNLTLSEQKVVAGGRMVAHPEMINAPGVGGDGGTDGYGDGDYGDYGGLYFGDVGGGGTINGLDVVDLPGPVVTPSASDIADANGCISMADAMAFGVDAEGAVFSLGSAGGGSVMEAVPTAVATWVKDHRVVSAGAALVAGKAFSNVFLAPGHAVGKLYGSAFNAVIDIQHGNQACIYYVAQ